jgi:hypothetical protein
MTGMTSPQQQIQSLFEEAVADLVSGKFADLDALLVKILEHVGGSPVCWFLQVKILLRLAQGRSAEARNITNFMAHTYSLPTIDNGWMVLAQCLSNWSFLTMLRSDYKRALDAYDPVDPLAERVAAPFLGAGE